MSCGESCETDSLFGSRGVCNLTSLECICPDGYSGRDDRLNYNDCHVNLSLQRTMWIIFVVMDIIAMIAVCGAFVYLCRHWSMVPEPAKRVTKRLSNFRSGDKKPRSMSLTSNAERKANALAYSRNRDTMLGLYLFISFTVCTLLYYVPFFTGDFPDMDHAWYQKLGLTLGANSILVGLWSVVYVWYRNLPSLNVFAKLFNIKSFLIRHPKAVKYTCYAHAILINIITFVLLFIVPTLWPTDEVQRTCDQLAFVFIFVYLVDFIVFFTFCIRLLRNIFLEVKQLAQAATVSESTGIVDQNPVNKTLRMTELLLYYVAFLSPVFLVETAYMAFVSQKNLFIFFNILLIQACVITYITVYILIEYLKGERRDSYGSIAPSSARNISDFTSELD